VGHDGNLWLYLCYDTGKVLYGKVCHNVMFLNRFYPENIYYEAVTVIEFRELFKIPGVGNKTDCFVEMKFDPISFHGVYMSHRHGKVYILD